MPSKAWKKQISENFAYPTVTLKNVENAHLPSLSEKLVQFDWSVPAHGDSVSSLQRIHEPASILSASHDHTVRIWGVKVMREESGLDLY